MFQKRINNKQKQQASVYACLGPMHVAFLNSYGSYASIRNIACSRKCFSLSLSILYDNSIFLSIGKMRDNF